MLLGENNWVGLKIPKDLVWGELDNRDTPDSIRPFPMVVCIRVGHTTEPVNVSRGRVHQSNPLSQSTADAGGWYTCPSATTCRWRLSFSSICLCLFPIILLFEVTDLCNTTKPDTQRRSPCWFTPLSSENSQVSAARCDPPPSEELAATYYRGTYIEGLWKLRRRRE